MLRALTFLICFGVAATASAQDFDLDYQPAADSPYHPRAMVGVEFATGTAAGGANYLGQSAFAFSPRVFGSYRVRDWLRLDASIPFAGLSVSTDGTSGADVGIVMANPYIAANILSVAGQFHYSIGFGIAFPVATAGTDVEGNPLFSSLLYQPSAILRGNWDMQLWTPNSLGFTVPFSLTTEILPGIHIDGEAALIFLVYVGSLAVGSTDFLAQLAATLRYDLNRTFDIGGRLQGVLQATNGGEFQTAFEPFVGAHTDHLFARVGFLLNLNPPNGFAFDAGQFWSARLTLGTRF